ncbi:U-box domain-containing protein 44-like isoform X2 [Actinidia eriantha]|uniref:U-box domain-containing protein 44-like isoform X2 n=1 Tax=Actinidia eriantha TaxID=165200 RepID=UPI002582B413|nr:U-box domain-containing protein 44-like isoform X2 [Actinidia eriantha]
MVMEFIPIGTILTVLVHQVNKTAQAATDVVFEKESFKVLSKHLFDIEPVLKELQLKLNDSQATRQALEFLEADVKKANNLVEKYNKNRSRIYLLIKCRHIVKEVQDVTRDIGRSLSVLSLANPDVLSRISEQVNRLQNEMQRAEFETSHAQIRIVDKLNQGLSEQNRDQNFVNDLLKDIANAVGVPVVPSKISKELESFKREKEEAVNRKERAEAFFLDQVIELLSLADAARDYEQIKEQYFQRVQSVDRYDSREECIPPFQAFICCISRTVMDDPVSLCTGTSCERTALEAWFERGEKTDPETGEALNQMQELMRENSINKDWITLAGLTDIVVSILGSSNNIDVKEEILITLKDIVEGNPRYKNKVIESQAFDHIIPCLGVDSSLSDAALMLLYELLQDRSGWDASFCRKLSQHQRAIHFLVNFLKSPVSVSKERAEEILMKLCDEDEKNVVRAAEADWFKPLIGCIIQGSESSRISMVREFVSMEVVEKNIKLLGEEGVIPTLLEMVSGNIESKELSLSALVKLSGCHENKERIAAAGGVPLLLKLMFTFHLRTIIIAKCSEILEKLASDGDGTKFFVDETGNKLDMEPIITNLLAFQQNPNTSYSVRMPILLMLLKICQSEATLVKTAVLTSNGVSLVLPLLDDSGIEIREVAINLLFLFSQQEPQGVVEYLLKPRRLEAFVGFLEHNSNGDVQMAAAGLLANLPKSEESLTKKLIELDGLNAIISLLKSGTMEAKENALSALFRFMDPTNLESQRIVVNLGAYPLLVQFLEDGSVTAKARAAALIGNLSMSSPQLTVMTKKGGCWCFRRQNHHLCSAHGGTCSVISTFCMLEANALPKMVNLLHEKVDVVTYEVIQALSSLVHEDSPHRGANALHQADAIKPILEVLSWGSESLKEEALRLLEKVFQSREMVDCYGVAARSALVRLTGSSINEGEDIKRKAAKVLSHIERYSRSSRSLVLGLSR